MQADTIVPNAANPLAFDRYQYVYSNPTRCNDPTGNLPGSDGGCGSMICDEDGNCVCSGTGHMKVRGIRFGPSPDHGMDNWVELPSPTDIPDYENRDPDFSHRQGVVDNYNKLRDWLYDKFGNKYVDKYGKIDDIALMALIICGEFGSYKGTDAFLEALEALQNQYHNTGGDSNVQCGGLCTLANQLMWLQDLEGFYGGNSYLSRNDFLKYMPDAERATQGTACKGICTSWMFGDVYNDQIREGSNDSWYYQVGSSWHRIIQRVNSVYGDMDWFIVWVVPGVGSSLP